MKPIKCCFGCELVVRKALCNVIVIFDAEYFAPEFNLCELVIALQYNQRRLQRCFLFRTQYHTTAAYEVDV